MNNVQTSLTIHEYRYAFITKNYVKYEKIMSKNSVL